MGACNSSVASRSTWDNELRPSTSQDVQEQPATSVKKHETTPDVYSTPKKPSLQVMVQTPREASFDLGEQPDMQNNGIKFIGILNNKYKCFIPSSENYFSDRIKVEKILIDPHTTSTVLPLKESSQLFKLSVLYPSTVVDNFNQYHWSIAERKDGTSLCVIISPRNQADLFKVRLMTDTKIVSQPTFMMKELRFMMCTEDIDYLCNSEVLKNFEFYHQEKLKQHHSMSQNIPRTDMAILGQNVLSHFVCVSFERFSYYYEMVDKQKLSLDMLEIKNLSNLFVKECKIPKGYLSWDPTVVGGCGYDKEDDPFPFNAAFLGGDNSPMNLLGSPSTSAKHHSMKRTLSTPQKSNGSIKTPLKSSQSLRVTPINLEEIKPSVSAETV